MHAYATEPESCLKPAAASSMFANVYENFRQEQEFGWFIPVPNPAKTYRYGHATNTINYELKYKQAAVMFLLGCIDGELQVMMTKRSQTVRTHKGLECLPGGGREPGETNPIETALREAQEETGLDPKLVTTVAIAPPFSEGLHRLRIVSPVVCVLNIAPENLKLSPCRREVDCVYWIPIRTFLESDLAETVKMSYISHDGPIYRTSSGFRFYSKGTGLNHFIWGLTAHICITLSAIALNQAPTFPYSENIAISSIWSEGDRLRVGCHSVALTTQQREEWIDYPNKVKPNLCINEWESTTGRVSKL